MFKTLRCPHCGKQITYMGESVATRIECPWCSGRFIYSMVTDRMYYREEDGFFTKARVYAITASVLLICAAYLVFC